MRLLSYTQKNSEVTTQLSRKELKQNGTIRTNQCAFQENKACQTNMVFIP